MINLNSGQGKLSEQLGETKISDSEAINILLDAAMQARRRNEKPRDYIGASALGEDCLRKLQYQYMNVPREEPFNGRTLRIFELGHVLEDLAIKWFNEAGFDLIPFKYNGQQFGWSQLSGRMKGHLDGIIISGPDEFGPYPRLWECKSMNNKKWNTAVKDGLHKEHRSYLTQIVINQAYIGLVDNPALLTAINKDTSALHHFSIPYNGRLAQEATDKGVRVVEAVNGGLGDLPRISSNPDFFICKNFCEYSKRCWGEV
jgi:hypothetical protein